MSAEGVWAGGHHSGSMPDTQDAAQGAWPLPLLFLMGLDGHDAIRGALGHLVCLHTSFLGQGRRNQESLPSLGKPEGGIDEALGVVIS